MLIFKKIIVFDCYVKFYFFMIKKIIPNPLIFSMGKTLFSQLHAIQEHEEFVEERERLSRIWMGKQVHQRKPHWSVEEINNRNEWIKENLNKKSKEELLIKKIWEDYGKNSFDGKKISNSKEWKIINCTSTDVFFDNFEDEKKTTLWWSDREGVNRYWNLSELSHNQIMIIMEFYGKHVWENKAQSTWDSPFNEIWIASIYHQLTNNSLWNKKQDLKLYEKVTEYEKSIWEGSVKHWASEEDWWIVLFFLHDTIKLLEEKCRNQS